MSTNRCWQHIESKAPQRWTGHRIMTAPLSPYAMGTQMFRPLSAQDMTALQQALKWGAQRES